MTDTCEVGFCEEDIKSHTSSKMHISPIVWFDSVLATEDQCCALSNLKLCCLCFVFDFRL